MKHPQNDCENADKQNGTSHRTRVTSGHWSVVIGGPWKPRRKAGKADRTMAVSERVHYLVFTPFSPNWGRNARPQTHKFAPRSICNVAKTSILSKCENVSYQQTRNAVSGFFNKHTAAHIWKSVSSVSSAGRRRGRGKIRGKKVIKDLNKGQVIGIGKENIRFPGLSSPIIRGRELVQRQKLPPDEHYQESLIKLRQPLFKAKRAKVSPLDRGWSGGNAGGRKVGPPDPVGDATFDGFESIILHQKAVFHMTSHMGRLRKVHCLVATGNGNGLVGYGLACGVEARGAVRRAKTRGGQRLMYIQRHEERTILHNFCSRFVNTRVFAWKQAPGYGLVCHRVIKSLCQLIGIKDIYAKVEGGTSALCITNAFLLGLLRQKSYEELASETKMHVVEMNPQNDFFPKILASPELPLESTDEPLDFELHCFDNNVYAWPKRLPPLYTVKDPRYIITVRKRENRRGHDDLKAGLFNEYDGLRSFLADRFPECKAPLPPWSKAAKELKKVQEEQGKLEE
ncbi:hypothetical protein V9T40_006602 [Parthenolecanium corni]|uniref:Small ribosomal subunit protein uS5m n=1 Tax=Parthenolecanium corni TaxID=536013 RepID=A0AAN9TPT8_9HEMI